MPLPKPVVPSGCILPRHKMRSKLGVKPPPCILKSVLTLEFSPVLLRWQGLEQLRLGLPTLRKSVSVEQFPATTFTLRISGVANEILLQSLVVGVGNDISVFVQQDNEKWSNFPHYSC